MDQFITCSNCEGEVSQDSMFCSHCGYVLADDAPRCALHPERESGGMCIVCQRVVCDQCSEESERRVFCLDHLDVIVEGDWAEVFRSTDPVDTEYARTLLEDAKFHVEMQGLGPGVEDRASQRDEGDVARVYVMLSEYMKAKDVLDDWRKGSPEFDSFN